MVSRIMVLIGVCGLAATLGACGDSTGLSFDPLLATDTVLIAAPTVAGNDTLPTAVDISGNGLGGIIGGVFPEVSSSATQWDFALRYRNGRLALVPAAEIGLNNGSSITQSLSGETMESLREAPGQSQFDDVAVQLSAGALYAARSRVLSPSCTAQYAKITPLEVDQASGRVMLSIVTNTRCGDPRLSDE